MAAKTTLKAKSNKVSLNIKISADIDARLKRARAEARKHDAMFNVSAIVDAALLAALKKVENQLELGPIESDNGDLFG